MKMPFPRQAARVEATPEINDSERRNRDGSAPRKDRTKTGPTRKRGERAGTPAASKKNVVNAAQPRRRFGFKRILLVALATFILFTVIDWAKTTGDAAEALIQQDFGTVYSTPTGGSATVSSAIAVATKNSPWLAGTLNSTNPTLIGLTAAMVEQNTDRAQTACPVFSRDLWPTRVFWWVKGYANRTCARGALKRVEVTYSPVAYYALAYVAKTYCDTGVDDSEKAHWLLMRGVDPGSWDKPSGPTARAPLSAQAAALWAQAVTEVKTAADRAGATACPKKA